MLTRDIVPADWSGCLESFSRRHAHAAATVEIHDPQHGPATEVFEGPLVGAEVERDPDGHEAIFLAIGGDHAPHWSRLIGHPRIVNVYQDPDGSDQALSIEADDGGYTYIRL